MVADTSAGEQHGCIVCGRLFDLLVIHSPDGRLVDCTVTSMGGRLVPDANAPLVACDSHTSAQIEAALNRRTAALAKEGEDEED